MSREPRIAVLRLPHAGDLPLPDYHSAGAAGLDLVAALPPETRLLLEPGRRHSVPTGIAVAIPDGFEAQVRPRSGLARDHGVTVLNAPGTIDCDYRGEIHVLLINLGEAAFEIVRGTRVAQLVVAPFVRVVLVEVPELNETSRASGGFGSTGTAVGTERSR